MKLNRAMIFALPLLVGLLGGCAERQSNSGGDVFAVFTGELEEGCEIKVLENDTAISNGYFQELLDAFNEAYEPYGITAVDANIGEYSDLATMGPYGTGPDVLYQANDVIMKYVDQQHVRPLPVEQLEAYDYLSDTAKNAYHANVSGNDYYFGVPVNVQSGLLYYRKDLLPDDWETEWDDNNNGVPDMVENLNDLYAYSKLLYEDGDEGKSQYGFVFSPNDFYFSSGFLFTYGGYIFGEDGTDTYDIGLGANDAALGAQAVLDLSSVMPVDCYDDTAKAALSGYLASGRYFCSVTTPDVHSTMVSTLATTYQTQDSSLTSEEATAMAEENIVAVAFPTFPADGDVTADAEDSEQIDSIMMGGINGYAMSSYTNYPNASLAFINFATSYEMVKLREEILDIAPCRSDVAEESDSDLTHELFEKIEEGSISIMPSVSALNQVWDPAASFFEDLVQDPSRSDANKKYDTLEKIQAGLDTTSDSIYAAIHTLS